MIWNCPVRLPGKQVSAWTEVNLRKTVAIRPALLYLSAAWQQKDSAP